MRMCVLSCVVLTLFVASIGVKSADIIYDLNETEYRRMPKLYDLDDYADCLLDPGGTYCLVDVNLYSDGPSELLDFIKAYSTYASKHFNHQQIHRGICVTQTCASQVAEVRPQNISLEKFLHVISNSKDQQKNTTLWRILDKCVDDLAGKQIGLRARLDTVRYCNQKNKRPLRDVDGIDILVAIICLVLVIANIIGSGYDYCQTKYHKGQGNAILLAFSFQRNWRKLMSDARRDSGGSVPAETQNSSGGGTDVRLLNLRGLQGLRFLTMLAVIFSHIVLLTSHTYVDNPIYIEKAFEDPLKQLLFNGSLVIQTYFSMASFLLAYNFMIFAEKNQFDFWCYPKGIINRWLRLTPLYLLIIGVIATWSRHLGSGPQWDLAVTKESQDCRANWWTHILYFNNYIALDKFCMPQTWYLAADSQLFLYGLTLMMVIWRYPKSAKVLFTLLMIVNILIPGVLTYVNEYFPMVAQRPESYRNLYATDDTFQNIYIRGHTNGGGYTLGLLAGYLHYQMGVKNIDIRKYKSFSILYTCVFPVGVGVMLTGALFYRTSYQYTPLPAAIYAAVYKNLFALCINIFILGMVNQCGRLMRGCVEWPPFQVVGRLSYCAYLLHTLYQRGYVGSIVKPQHMTDYHIFVLLAASVALTYMTALPLSLMVEAPAHKLQKMLFAGRRRNACAGQPRQEGERTTRNITLYIADDKEQFNSKL